MIGLEKSLGQTREQTTDTMAPLLQGLVALAIFVSSTTSTAIPGDHPRIPRIRPSFTTSQHVLQRNPIGPTPSVIDIFHDPSLDRTLSKRGDPEDASPIVDDPPPGRTLSKRGNPEDVSPVIQNPAPVIHEEYNLFVMGLEKKLADEEDKLMDFFEWETDFLKEDYNMLQAASTRIILYYCQAPNVDQLSEPDRKALVDQLDSNEKMYRKEQRFLRGEHAGRLEEFLRHKRVMLKQFDICGWKDTKCRVRKIEPPLIPADTE